MIACDVPAELGAPPLGIGFGCHPVLGAAVPEAPVDEHGHLGLGEQDIDAASFHPGQRDIHPVLHGTATPMSDSLTSPIRAAIPSANHPRHTTRCVCSYLL